MNSLFPGEIWIQDRDGEPHGFALARRHYSAKKNKKPKRNRFVGPGERIVLISPNYDALFVWRKFIDDSGQKGVNCAVFRNEGPMRASLMILDAEQWAWTKWPGERLYTYVDAKELPGSCPGYCFRRAGWKSAGFTKGGLLILEKRASK